MSYDLWKTRDPNDTGFYDMPEDDGPSELDLAYDRIRELEIALRNALCELTACANQLTARGLPGREGDSVSRARSAARKVLGGVGSVK